MAGILCVSEACVRFHLHNIYRKMQVRGKTELLLILTDIGFDR
ncbi:MAG: LuxR C-terminal-related transcriptional regulator, partial [Firmicutes bacterium]|nr:LuxR C-terminal-related transcriptional regulator [Bacillota bacterium]